MKRDVQRMRVCLIESPSAMDLFMGHTETDTLSEVCRLLGHEFAAVTVRSNDEFKTAVRHLTSIDESHASKARQSLPLCLRLAAHGNKDGLAMGADDANWEFVANVLRQFSKEMKHYTGPLVLILSSCEAEFQKITGFFRRFAADSPGFRPPAFIFTTVSNKKGEVYWRDSVVAWSIFYHQTGAAVLSDREEMKTVVDKIRLVGAGALKYFRWDSEMRSYKSYESSLIEHGSEA